MPCSRSTEATSRTDRRLTPAHGERAILRLVRKRAAPWIFAVVVVLSGCGAQQRSSSTPTPQPTPVTTSGAPQAHPQAIEPAAGAVSPSGAGSSAPASVSVGPASGGGSTSTGGLAQPVSDAAVRRELTASGLSANSNQATLTPDGLAIAPVNAPYAVQAVISAGNEIAHLPYVWGGGHARYIDTGYDCSGSLSFVFAAAGLLNTTMTSGQLMSWDSRGRASGSRCSPHRATRSCTWPGSDSTRSRSRRRARGGRTDGPTSRT